MTDEQIKQRIEELKAQRDQLVAQVNMTTGAIMAFEEMLSSRDLPKPPAPKPGAIA